MDKEALEKQIADEAKALREAPVIQPIVGMVKRCHICGAVGSANDILPFREGTHDVHPGLPQREACANCHPKRSA
jgi:hypothetical protein